MKRHIKEEEDKQLHRHKFIFIMSKIIVVKPSAFLIE